MMRSFVLKDNNEVQLDGYEEVKEHPIINHLVDKNLSELEQDGIIIFPQQLSDSVDLTNENLIFETRSKEVWTGNVVGLLSDGEDDIRITSRFTEDSSEDYFLRHMLQTVLNYNVINTKILSSKETSYYDLLVFLFPYYLNQAMKKGLYKEYVTRDYNDANIKGPIDIARHLKQNVPFMGSIAYRAREFSYDNSITQLIRHTIEKTQQNYDMLLFNESVTKEHVRSIKQATSSYSRVNRDVVIQKNIENLVKHGYYEEYTALQTLCISILTEQKVGFGRDDKRVNGIIIDVSWLWEEYIWKVTDWKHYGRKTHLPHLNLFSDPKGAPRYPDFSLGKMPIDTKYKKKLDTRNDYNQMTTYMHIMSAEKGIFLQPSINESGKKLIGKLAGLGGKMFTYKFKVPQYCVTFEEFQEKIKEVESTLKSLKL